VERLPQLVADCAAEWELSVGDPYPGHAGLVLRVECADGTPAVLKVNYVDPETEHEPDALAFWPDDACVRLLAHDRDRGALLLERCVPGTTLWQLPEDDATAIAAHVLDRLWSAGDPGPPFRRLTDEAPAWTEKLGERTFERTLLDEALAALRELPWTQRELVLCSEDFHGGNVLLSNRAWLAIDPKPIVAEREFGVVSLVRDRRPVDRRTLNRRLDFLTAELGLDRDRMRRWSLAHALWWGFADEAVHPDHVEVARALVG
jgi:streptomycin 6-kinase